MYCVEMLHGADDERVIFCIIWVIWLKSILPSKQTLTVTEFLVKFYSDKSRYSSIISTNSYCKLFRKISNKGHIFMF